MSPRPGLPIEVTFNARDQIQRIGPVSKLERSDLSQQRDNKVKENPMERRRTLLSLIAVSLLLVATLASSQTYTKLYSYPIGAGASSVIAYHHINSNVRDCTL